ncbi:MAG: HAD hydrolase-like protein [Planctomycetes bacterium]|nr:HAD hydrolase-like protein [Planctomycetota bacterium]
MAHSVCLFDIDGTLLDTGGAGLAAMQAALQSEFGVRLEEGRIPTAGRTDRAIVLDMMACFGIPESDETLSRFTAAYLQHLRMTLHQRRGLVLPGVPELLRRLHEHPHVHVGLLTGNFREGARLKLEHYGLYHYFQFGGFGDRARDRNDVAREALVEVHRHLDGKVSLERIWVVGDTPADVECGRAIGARVIAVGTGIVPNSQVQAAGPDFFFKSFADPTDVLRLVLPDGMDGNY